MLAFRPVWNHGAVATAPIHKASPGAVGRERHHGKCVPGPILDSYAAAGGRDGRIAWISISTIWAGYEIGYQRFRGFVTGRAKRANLLLEWALNLMVLSTRKYHRAVRLPEGDWRKRILDCRCLDAELDLFAVATMAVATATSMSWPW